MRCGMLTDIVTHGRKADAVDDLLFRQRLKTDVQVEGQTVGRGIERDGLQIRGLLKDILQQMAENGGSNAFAVMVRFGKDKVDVRIADRFRSLRCR